MTNFTPEDREIIAATMKRLAEQVNGGDQCVECGARLKALRQTGRSVYGQPETPSDCTDTTSLLARLRASRQNPAVWCRQYQGIVSRNHPLFVDEDTQP